MCVLIAQMCRTLCDPMDRNPPDSSVRGILQARRLEWVAIPFSGDLPDPGMEPGSPALQADAVPSQPPGKSMILHKDRHIQDSMGGLSCEFMLHKFSISVSSLPTVTQTPRCSVNVGEEKEEQGTQPPASGAPASSRCPSPTLLSGCSRFTTDKGCNQRGERTGALLKGSATVSVGPITDHHVASGTSLPAQGPVCTKMGLLRASGFGLCAPKSLGVSLLSQ